jgi:PPM family protein phosphatase
MSLVIVDAAYATHPGQVRSGNEDAVLVAPPLFVVADGMGGALAGEVASGLAVDAFAAAEAADASPETLLRRAIADANQRIQDRARIDTATSGMGTTLTAAIVGDELITFAHVGDSRAYLYRDGALQQLSDDHSLVGELVRRGAITPAEAERHPQKSIITRNLGGEEAVEADTFTVEPRAGDVFMLCSDGLSGMLRDETIAAVLGAEPSLAPAASALVEAANAAGGEDNITVVLFRLGDGPAISASDITASAVAEPRPATTRPAPLSIRPRSWRRRVVLLVTLPMLSVAIAIAAAAFLAWAHFVGATANGRVAIYQGVPLDVAGGLRLYRAERVTQIPVAALSAGERRVLFDHALRSKADAEKRVAALAAAAYWNH